VEAPYRGSYFTLAMLPDGAIVIGGLKGNAFRSSDGGAHFERLAGFLPVSLSASALLGDGRLLFSSQAGQLYVGEGPGVRAVPLPHTAPLSAVVQAANGDLVVAGVRGVASLPANILSSRSGATP
jgi:hypothetical protein